MKAYCRDEGMTWQAIPVTSRVCAMRKLIMVMLFLALSLTGGAGETSGVRTIVATFYPIRLTLMNLVIGVDGVQVFSLADSEAGCLHDYQLTPRDMAVLSKAEVVVVNGAGLESFLASSALNRPGLKVINASKGIDLLVSGGVTNSHVWVSPDRYIRQVRQIADGLAGWDPLHAESYRKNATNYIVRIEGLKQAMDLKLRQLGSREIITFHEAFPYFADEFNFKVAGIIEREPGSAPSAAEMAALIQIVKAKGVRSLFVEPQYPAKIAAAIARESGARIFTLDPVVSGPLSSNAYIEIMGRNLEQIEQALQ